MCCVDVQMNQNKLPSRVVDSRAISRGPDFTPAFADFGRQMGGGRGTAVSQDVDLQVSAISLHLIEAHRPKNITISTNLLFISPIVFMLQLTGTHSGLGYTVLHDVLLSMSTAYEHWGA